MDSNIGDIAIIIILVICIIGAIIASLIGGRRRSLKGIKSITTGDGQHGAARWATKGEMRSTYSYIPFCPAAWRQGHDLPSSDDCGVILGQISGQKTTAIVDTDDVHTLCVGSPGMGKTAYILYPNMELACACGVSFVTTDTKGDIYRHYGCVARDRYGYNISVIDLRNPTRSSGNNILYMTNLYMDRAANAADPAQRISYESRAEQYAGILAKTIIFNGANSADMGQNAYFYDSAEGLLTAVILLVSKYGGRGERHISSVYQLTSELLEPARDSQRWIHVLMDMLPGSSRAKIHAAAALAASRDAAASVMSTVLSKLRQFMIGELEQILCRDPAFDIEAFAQGKHGIFLVMPEEDPTTYFMISFFVQQIYRELLVVSDKHGGRLSKRVMFYLDEFGTLPPITDAKSMLSAARSRGIYIFMVLQSFAQLDKNYGQAEREIMLGTIQDTISGGFAPQAESAEIISKQLGSRTVQVGTVSGASGGWQKNNITYQMTGRPLMTADELRTMPRGTFIIQKYGCHPWRSKMRLYKDWGIEFDDQEIGPNEVVVDHIPILSRTELLKKIGSNKSGAEDTHTAHPESDTRRKIVFNN